MLYTPAFAWVSAGENAKPQNFLCLLLLGTEVKKKKKRYYNEFKLTFIVNTKTFSYEL